MRQQFELKFYSRDLIRKLAEGAFTRGLISEEQAKMYTDAALGYKGNLKELSGTRLYLFLHMYLCL